MHYATEGTLSVNAIGPIQNVEVTGDGAGVTNQAGTHLLGELAGRLGIAEGFSRVLAETTVRASAYDRGVVLTQLAMTLAAGGRCVSDLKVLRDQPGLFGQVASDATAWRAVHQVDGGLLDQLRQVRVQATRQAVAAADPTEVIIDVDATLIDVDSEIKQGAAATFKGGFGFAPMAATIEPLGAVGGLQLRPGNATANDAADQLEVIDEAIASLPAPWRAGHTPGDDPELVRRGLTVRGDTAACSRQVVCGLADRNITFSVGMRTSDAAAAVIADLAADDGWQPAIDTDGRARPAAFVIEATQLVPDWAPEGHPGDRAP